MQSLMEIIKGDIPSSLAEIAQSVLDLSYGQIRSVRTFCLSLLNYLSSSTTASAICDFRDCSFGNLLFAGCFLRCEKNFNIAVREFCQFAKINGRVLNVTKGENLYLVGLKEDGTFLRNEAEIVAPQNSAAMLDIFLLESYLGDQQEEQLSRLSLDKKRAYLNAISKTPSLNQEVVELIAEADIIIYGPGTQHSSLLPSYLTEGIVESIAANKRAEKIFISNILRDHEIQSETANSLTEKLFFYLNLKGRSNFQPHDLVSMFFFQLSSATEVSDSAYVKFVPEQFPYGKDRVILANWEEGSGRHSRGRVLDELITVINRKLQKQLDPFPYLVSIVVPGLNEERTVHKVLHELSLLDLQPYGVGKEIIFVDGGSKDRTLELACSVLDVVVSRVPKGSGRGAALRRGIDLAKGNIIVFFPSDAEYVPKDVVSVITPITRKDFRVVFGSRAIRCGNLTDLLRGIYRGNRILYLLSKYGGMMISILSLVLYNRYVNDALTGVKAFDARILRGLRLKASGLDLETEIVAKLGKTDTFILEVPIEFFPRTRQQGKKTTVFDGVCALFALMRHRL